jgi:hypothetical protein
VDAQVLDEDLASLVGNPIAELLDLDLDSSDFPNARVLREALTGGRNRAAPQAESRTLMSTPSADGMVTELHLQALGDVTTLDSAVSSRQEQLAAETDGSARMPLPKSMSITITGGKNYLVVPADHLRTV